MNLPQLTALIGEQERIRRASYSELAMLVQPLEVSEGKQPYLCFLTFDLLEGKIRLEDLKPFDKEDLYIYNYFGNNSAASLQFFVTRKVDSLHYLLLSCLSDLAFALEKNKLTDGELYKLLLQLQKSGMIELKSAKGKGKINLRKIKGVNNENISIRKDNQKVKIVVGDKTYTSEAFARYLLQIETSANNELTIVIPRIKTNENQPHIIISQHPDYISVTKKEQKLELTSKKKQKRICFICQKEKEGTSSSVTAKFNRSGINKLFTTTTINTARDLNKNNYDDNYAICGDCFQNLLFGERVISSKFQGRIAGERAIILPEALIGNFTYEYLYGIKRSVDLAFNPINFEEWKNQLDVEKDEILHNPGYIVHFVIYRTDGNSISVLDVFGDVQLSRIGEVSILLGKNAAQIPGLRWFSLGSIYRIIPVRTNKKGDQLDIQRVLSVYKALLANHLLETELLYQYAMEALEKGLFQIRKKKITQYQNLSLNRYIPDKEDFYIKDIVMKYLCLLKSCQDLCVLDKIPFSNRKVGDNYMNQNLQDETISAIEGFLTEQNFDRLSRALFYLGTLINVVGRAQSGKGHKSKPILNKIQFQGMNGREVIWLYQEVLDKLRQYDQMKYPLTERLLSQFNRYYGVLKTKNELSEQANVFYIMSGYAYMTGVSFAKGSGKEGDHSNDNNTNTNYDDEN